VIATLDKETIDNLKAGPETDALVAEALGCKFGWHHPRTYYTDCIKPYSTDWSAVMKGASQVAAHGKIAIYGSKASDGTETWSATLDFCAYPVPWEQAATGPLAMSKAIARWKSPTVQT